MSPGPAFPVGHQSWRRLLFAHWPVSASTLRPLVPGPLAIDEYDGTAYVSLVAFVVGGARPLGVPSQLGLHFLETNVRTYVRSRGEQPGVYFLSLDATSLCAVLGARIAVGLPYFWAAGREQVRAEVVDYRLRRRVATPGCHLRYTIGRYLGPAMPQTVDHFLLERYLLHVQRGPSLWTIRVRHQPYPLRSLTLERLHTDLVRAAGIHVEPSPSSVHFAAGVDVAFLRPHIGLFHNEARNQPV